MASERGTTAKLFGASCFKVAMFWKQQQQHNNNCIHTLGCSPAIRAADHRETWQENGANDGWRWISYDLANTAIKCPCFYFNYAVEYDWMPKEPSSTNSDFIRDILAYLESMFATLQLLPVISYSQPAYSCFVCMHSWDYIILCAGFCFWKNLLSGNEKVVVEAGRNAIVRKCWEN